MESRAQRTVLIVGLNYAPEPTGIAPYTTGLARMLAEAGHRVHVVTGFPHYPEWRVAAGYRGRRLEETDGPEANPIRVTRVAHPIPARPTGTGRILMEAAFAAHAATVRSPRPDTVIAISPALLSVATARLRSGRRRGTTLGVVVQDLYTAAVTETGVLGGHGAGIAHRLERGLLRHADGVVAIHESFRASLLRLGVEPERITVIRNWTHIRDMTGDPAALRTRLGWPEHHTVALHAGNMGAKQGLENVVDAARFADECEADVTFVLLGDGHRRAALETRAHGIRRIQFLPLLPEGEFETALAAADVLLLNERPGVADMCVPSKLTSYFSSGRPVVAATSDAGAAAVEVRAAGAGIVLPSGRPELLLDAVMELGADRARAARLGRNARRYAREIYGEAAARAGYLDWVDRLVATPAGAPPTPERPTPPQLLAPLLRRQP